LHYLNSWLVQKNTCHFLKNPNSLGVFYFKQAHSAHHLTLKRTHHLASNIIITFLIINNPNPRIEHTFKLKRVELNSFWFLTNFPKNQIIFKFTFDSYLNGIQFSELIWIFFCKWSEMFNFSLYSAFYCLIFDLIEIWFFFFGFIYGFIFIFFVVDF